MGVQKIQKDEEKIKFPLKVTKFAGKIRIDLRIHFYINSFFYAALRFSDIVNFNIDCIHSYKCF